MTHGELRLYLKGHSDRLYNETANAVIGGYYSAYFSWSKEPKTLQEVLLSIKSASDTSEKLVSVGTVDFETARRIDEQIANGKLILKGG